METLAERLKKIRLEKGLSLEEVQKKTKIHLSILKALEGDSLTNLSPIYLKGFMKIYCNFLGIDPKEISPSAPVREKRPAEEKASVTQKTEAKPLERPVIRPKLLLLPKIVPLMIGISVIIVSMALFKLGKSISHKRSAQLDQEAYYSPPMPKSIAKTQQKESKAGVKEAKITTKTQKINEPEKTVKETVAGIKLGIRAREKCWVSLKVDGKIVFQRMLEKGRFESWQAKDNMDLSLGNAGVVDLEVNGQLFSNLGKKGQAIKHIIINKEGLKILR